MRIVAVADTHTFEADLGILPDGDVLVHAGDLCRAGTLDELAGVVGWIHAQPHRNKIVVAGNHDGCFEDERRERAEALLGPEVTYLQDSLAVVEGVRFWGTPWQPAFHDWAFNLPRGAPLAEKWALIPSGIDVLVTHSPPAGFGDRLAKAGRTGPAGWARRLFAIRPAGRAAQTDRLAKAGGKGPTELARRRNWPWPTGRAAQSDRLAEGGPPGREGCAELLEAVRRVRPALHLFGHIHQDGGLWRDSGDDGETVLVNVTTWECERGATVIDYDPGARVATPVVIPSAGR